MPATIVALVYVLDPDESKYNNPKICLCLIMQGNPGLTASFNTSTIPSKRFIIGSQHDKTHEMVKQAIFDSYGSTLSRLYDLEPQVKEALSDLVDQFYKLSHIGDNTFRFTIPNKSQNFTFAAATKNLSQMPQDSNNVILCIVPKELTDHILSITTCVLEDRCFRALPREPHEQPGYSLQTFLG